MTQVLCYTIYLTRLMFIIYQHLSHKADYSVSDTLTPTHERNVHDMYSVLRRNGFKRRNVKVFYANGMRDGIQGEKRE